MAWIAIFFSAGSLCLACLVGYINTALQTAAVDSVSWGSIIRETLFSMVLLTMTCVMFDIARLQPSRHHTFNSLISQYLFIRKLPYRVFFIKRRLGLSSGDMMQCQKALLLDIIRRNEATKYGKDNKFDEMQTVENFRSTQPLTSYDSYKDYVTDILNGEHNILFPGKVDFLGTTSGTTTGKSKLFPKSYKATGQDFRDLLTLIRGINVLVPGMEHLKFWHPVTITSRRTTAPTGIPLGSSSSVPPTVLPFYAAPPAVYQVFSDPKALYIHALFGIKNEDISFLIFWTTPFLLGYLGTIRDNWENLCDDIEKGTINKSIKIDTSIRLEIEKHLWRDAERANHLRSIFRAGFHDLIPRIWPSCKLVCANSSGSFSSATDILKRQYLGNVQLMATLHVGTEGAYGVNMDPVSRDENCFSIMPSVNFYEFIPMGDVDSPTPQTLLADEVEIGGEYELVVTTKSGLYRYRTQDVVRVTGFMGQIPYYRFLQRTGDVLSANVDKYPERLFTEAIAEAAAKWGNYTVLNYIATESIHVDRILGQSSRTMCCYYIFIELVEDGCKLSQDGKSKIDEYLMDKLDDYQRLRSLLRIDQPVIIQIKNGSIHHVRDMLLKSNPDAVLSQYKYPRFIRRQDVLQYLLTQQV